MNTKAVNSAAGVVLAALQQNRTAAGIALALDSAQMLMTPETAAELETLRARVAELEAELGIGSPWTCEVCSKENTRDVCVICETDRPEPRERTVDEGPIAYALTDKAEAECDHPNGYGPYGCAGCGEFRPPADEEDVTPQVRKLRSLLAGQRAAVEDQHDSPLHHPYRLGRDLPQAGGAS